MFLKPKKLAGNELMIAVQALELLSIAGLQKPPAIAFYF